MVEKAVHGEFTVDDLFRLAKAGRITVGLAREDDGGKTPVMAVAFEFRRYPSATAVNVLAMGGRDLARFMTRFLPPFSAFCKGAGADWIECAVSPAMARMHGRYGFRPVYRNMRLDIRGETC